MRGKIGDMVFVVTHADRSKSFGAPHRNVSTVATTHTSAMMPYSATERLRILTAGSKMSSGWQPDDELESRRSCSSCPSLLRDSTSSGRRTGITSIPLWGGVFVSLSLGEDGHDFFCLVIALIQSAVVECSTYSYGIMLLIYPSNTQPPSGKSSSQRSWLEETRKGAREFSRTFTDFRA